MKLYDSRERKSSTYVMRTVFGEKTACPDARLQFDLLLCLTFCMFSSTLSRLVGPDCFLGARSTHPSLEHAECLKER